jgi:hypothetical protein
MNDYIPTTEDKEKSLGRPPKYTDEVIEQIRLKLEEYINLNNIPIVAEFAYQNEIPRQKLYEFEALNDTLKRLIDKKEANLERSMLNGTVKNISGYIFSLKQLGWKDRQEIEHTGGINIVISKEDESVI